ncbi:hypothetical protein N7501_002217 [Penicillium viridicatum]|nr:hypothetical protein N7501_002217 [Penicillium viridicatum]
MEAPQTPIPSTNLPLVLPMVFIDLENELRELIHLEAAMDLYNKTVGFSNLAMMAAGEIPISDVISTKAMLALHLESCAHAREKEAYLVRCIRDRLRQIPEGIGECLPWQQRCYLWALKYRYLVGLWFDFVMPRKEAMGGSLSHISLIPVVILECLHR